MATGFTCDCGNFIDLGAVSVPKEQEFVDIVCSECGKGHKKSLLRLSLKEKATH